MGASGLEQCPFANLPEKRPGREVAGLIPIRRHPSSTFSPFPACCNAATICSSVCPFLGIPRPPPPRFLRTFCPTLLQFPLDQFPGFGSYLPTDSNDGEP